MNARAISHSVYLREAVSRGRGAFVSSLLLGLLLRRP